MFCVGQEVIKSCNSMHLFFVIAMVLLTSPMSSSSKLADQIHADGGSVTSIEHAPAISSRKRIETFDITRRQFRRLFNPSDVVIDKLKFQFTKYEITSRVTFSWLLVLLSKCLTLASPLLFSKLVNESNKIQDPVLLTGTCSLGTEDTCNILYIVKSSLLGLIVGYGASKLLSGLCLIVSEFTLFPVTGLSAGILPLEAFMASLKGAERRTNKINIYAPEKLNNTTFVNNNEPDAVASYSSLHHSNNTNTNSDSQLIFFARRALDRGMRASNLFFYRSIFSLIPTFVEVLTILVVMTTKVSINVSIVGLLFVVTYMGTTMYSMHQRVKIVRRQLREEGAANECCEDAHLLAETVSAFGSYNAETNKYAAALRRITRLTIDVRTSFSLLKFNQTLILGLFSMVLVLVTWHTASADSAASIGAQLVMVQGLFAQLYAPLDNVGLHYRDCISSCEDLRELEYLAEDNKYDKVTPTKQSLDPATLKTMDTAKPKLVLRNLSYIRPSRIPAPTNVQAQFKDDDSHRVVLSNISLTIPNAGYSIGLVGPSACGKSTLLKYLMGMDIEDDTTDTNNFEMEVHGIDVTNCNRELFFCPVLQENLIFKTLTLIENIQYNIESYLQYPLTDSELKRSDNAMTNALKDAQLQSLISTKTDHQSKGVVLSGGERQRLCIARALYHQEMRGGILLLDEFTSHLDAKNEAHVVDSLFSRIKTQGASAIIVAHRLATVQHCDEILVMNNGEISERGTHQQLLANKGWYAEMWRIQSNSRTNAA